MASLGVELEWEQTRGKMNHSIDVWKEQYYDYMDLMTADI